MANLKEIRIGNDIGVRWFIKHNNEAYSLEGKDLRVILHRGTYQKEVTGFEISGNIVQFNFYGKDQDVIGTYYLTLIENDMEVGMKTVDSCPAFKLVTNSCAIGSGTGGSAVQIETVTLESSIETVISDISVIDNLNSDSATSALSAKQGKILNQTKQATLVSGTNIRTVNNKSLVGDGNVAIKEGHDVINDLVSTRTDAALSAYQGRVLDEKISTLDSEKQDTLVSGTNIKTINNESILGEGNITIEGGGGTAGVTSVNTRTGDVVLTKTDVGLNNVDNTSDANKPVSTLQQTALNEKVDKVVGEGLISNIEKNRLANVDNYDDTELRESIASKQPTLVSGTNIKTINGETLLGSGNILIDGGSGVAGVSSVNGKTGVVTLTKDDLSLGNVDNTSDIDKPVSTEQQMALDGKVDKVVGEGLISNIEKNRLANVDNYDDTELRESITNLDNTKVDKVTGKSLVSDTEITRLASVDNYDDTAIKTRVTNVETKNSEQDTAIAGKQATLVSGTNIKTINNESLLGEGNITIEGGTTAGVTSVNTRTGAVTLTAEDVNLGNVDNTSDADKPISTATQNALDLKANTTDIPTIPDIDIPAVTGGNAITDITVDATDKHKINVTKGTFLTDHQDISGKLDTSTYNSDKETQAAKDLEQDNAIAEKQATLVFSGEGQNIKTVGGTSLSGTGNIAVGDANVQSDWDATEGDAFILNKPTIPIIPDITIPGGDLVAGEAITSLTPNGHTITATKGAFLTDSDKPSYIKNTQVTTWTADTTYSDYGYKADIALEGVTADTYVEVIFALTEATSGDYAPICSSGAGIVTIYSKVNTTITIPTIIIEK